MTSVRPSLKLGLGFGRVLGFDRGLGLGLGRNWKAEFELGLGLGQNFKLGLGLGYRVFVKKTEFETEFLVMS